MDTETPIASVDQFKSALLRLRDQRRFQKTPFLDMLRLHCGAPSHRITTTELAAGLHPPLASHSAANLQYGKLAHLVADELNFVPARRGTGSPMWWQALATAEDGPDTNDGHAPWIMRPELVAALLEMNWSK